MEGERGIEIDEQGDGGGTKIEGQGERGAGRGRLLTDPHHIIKHLWLLANY